MKPTPAKPRIIVAVISKIFFHDMGSRRCRPQVVPLRRWRGRHCALTQSRNTPQSFSVSITSRRDRPEVGAGASFVRRVRAFCVRLFA